MVDTPISNTLIGMKAISQFIGLSEASVLAIKRSHPNMPINKGDDLSGGVKVWVGHRGELDSFMALYAKGEAHLYNPPKDLANALAGAMDPPEQDADAGPDDNDGSAGQAGGKKAKGNKAA